MACATLLGVCFVDSGQEFGIQLGGKPDGGAIGGVCACRRRVRHGANGASPAPPSFRRCAVAARALAFDTRASLRWSADTEGEWTMNALSSLLQRHPLIFFHLVTAVERFLGSLLWGTPLTGLAS